MTTAATMVDLVRTPLSPVFAQSSFFIVDHNVIEYDVCILFSHLLRRVGADCSICSQNPKSQHALFGCILIKINDSISPAVKRQACNQTPPPPQPQLF